MPITVGWDSDEHTVVLYSFKGKWTWEEYHSAIAQAFALVKDIPYVVNMILDFSEGQMFPSNALSHFRSSMNTPPRDFDIAVVISKSGFVDTIVNVFRRMYGKAGDKFIVFKTLEQGRAFFVEREAHNLPSNNTEHPAG